MVGGAIGVGELERHHPERQGQRPRDRGVAPDRGAHAAEGLRTLASGEGLQRMQAKAAGGQHRDGSGSARVADDEVRVERGGLLDRSIGNSEQHDWRVVLDGDSG